ncbi:hypothetical protein [Labrys neptuniae]
MTQEVAIAGMSKEGTLRPEAGELKRAPIAPEEVRPPIICVEDEYKTQNRA